MYDGFGFDALDAIEGAASASVPVLVGAGTSFGLAQTLDLTVENATVKKWKWAFGLGLSTVIGLALWKWRSPEEGAVTIASGLAAFGLGMGYDKILAYKAEKGLAGLRGRGFRGRALGAYKEFPARPLFAGRPMGAYQAGAPQSLYDGGTGPDPQMVDLNGYYVGQAQALTQAGAGIPGGMEQEIVELGQLLTDPAMMG